uniref:Polycystin 1 like 3, transient receptor potential channel interacting n=1 Tax=Varanus komodoensis TaxID=61221 RepID=A0A8D2LFP5_VARKO
ALNPFRHLDGTAVGSVASVSLVASREPLRIQGLAEEIEVGVAPSPRKSGKGVLKHGPLLLPASQSQPSSKAGTEHGGSHLGAPLPLLPTLAPVPEGAYVWVIPAEELRHGVGTFHISAEVGAGRGHGGAPPGPASSLWVAETGPSPQVGPRSTPGSIQCLCSHLSFFGRVVLVLPHRICLQCTGQLLRRVGQNPAGVALLGSLLLGYGVALLWVRQRQKADAGKVKVTALADNAAGASYLYLVQVFTGHRRGAGTSAKVTLTIYGAEGRSEAHLLRHPEPPCLERGGMDAFLLATWTPLGELHAVRLWHSNTGPSPSWYVHAGKKWHFLAGRWLAVELGDGQLDGVFVAASERELLSFRHLFWEGLVGKLTQEHLWLSVGSCSPWSPFTRAQRLSCCFALLLCSMLTSIMFWKEPPEDGSRPKPGEEEEELAVAGAHVAPLICVSPPMENPLCRCRDMSGFPGTPTRLPELVSGLCGLIHSHLQHLEDSEVPPPGKRGLSLAVSLHPWNLSPAAHGFLELSLGRSQKNETDTRRRLSPEGSCHLLHYLCHVVNDLEAQLRTLGGSSQPDPYDCLHAAGQLRQLWQRLAQQHQAWPCGAEPRYSETALSAAVEPARPSHRCPSRRGLVSWGVLGATCLATAFFTGLYSLQMDKEQAARWAITTLLSVLQNILLLQPLKVSSIPGPTAALAKAPGRAPPCSRDCSSPLYRPPALTPSAPWKERAQQEEKLCFLLREIVVQLLFLAVLMVLGYRERGPHEFCLNNALRKVFATKLKDVRTQEQLYSWARQSLLPGVYSDAQGEGCHCCCVLYQMVGKVGADWQLLEVGGGRCTPCTPNCHPLPFHSLAPLLSAGALLSTAELQILRLYPSSDGLVQLACAHTTFLLFVLYYIVVQGRQVKRQKLRYFGSKGSLLDASVTLISVAAVGLHVKRSLLAHGLLRRHRQDRTRFISFQETVEVDSALTYLIAFLIALATVKLWKLLQLHSRMRLITETLRKGWDKALGLLVALLVLLTGYASGCNLMFGWSIADYKTFFDSGVTIVGLLVGIFNYEEVIALDPVLGSALIVTGVFSMVFVILNLFVSALLTIFSQEMKAAKARKEESVMRLLRLKISALLGVERQTTVVAATALEAQD